MGTSKRTSGSVRRHLLAAAMSTCLLASAGQVQAQSSSAMLRGQVLSGTAPTSEARVTATNTETSFARTVQFSGTTADARLHCCCELRSSTAESRVGWQPSLIHGPMRRRIEPTARERANISSSIRSVRSAEADVQTFLERRLPIAQDRAMQDVRRNDESS